MSKSVLTAHQPSMTEWFAAIGEVSESEAFRIEDNTKTSRLDILLHTAGVPYRPAKVFSARAMWDKTPEVEELLLRHGDEPCAFRLVPTDPSLPKLRNRGLTIRDCYTEWFRALAINPDKYTVHVFPNETEIRWSTIFVINDEGIFGEIVPGVHSQLSQGVTTHETYQFSSDFQGWQYSTNDKEVQMEIQRTLQTLMIKDIGTQKSLKDQLKAQFTHNYLVGYFETIVPPDGHVYFLDYNRILSALIHSAPVVEELSGESTAELRGAVAYPGKVTGKVYIIDLEKEPSADFPDGGILICDNTDIRYLVYMKKAAAIVTNRGGILSHAAIIARELKVPCIIGTKTATELLKDGDMVEVDADTGIVRKI